MQETASRESRDPQPVAGTMKVHAVNGLEENKVAVRNISCFCYNCFPAMQFEEKSCCDGWSTHNLQKGKGNKITSTNHDAVQPKQIDHVKHANEPNEDVAELVQKNFQLEVGDFVAAIMKSTSSHTYEKWWKLMTPMPMSLSWKHLRQLSTSVQCSSGPEIEMKFRSTNRTFSVCFQSNMESQHGHAH